MTLAAEKKTNTDDDADDDDADARHLATFLRFKRVSLFLKDEPGMKINFERLNLSFRGIVVIIEAEGRKIAMFVDALVGQHQVVIKSLETNYRRVHGISGATIMGDGTVALILDAVAIGQSAQPILAAA